jgi:hypothetical protein
MCVINNCMHGWNGFRNSTLQNKAGFAVWWTNMQEKLRVQHAEPNRCYAAQRWYNSSSDQGGEGDGVPMRVEEIGWRLSLLNPSAVELNGRL